MVLYDPFAVYSSLQLFEVYVVETQIWHSCFVTDPIKGRKKIVALYSLNVFLF